MLKYRKSHKTPLVLLYLFGGYAITSISVTFDRLPKYLRVLLNRKSNRRCDPQNPLVTRNCKKIVTENESGLG